MAARISSACSTTWARRWATAPTRSTSCCPTRRSCAATRPSPPTMVREAKGVAHRDAAAQGDPGDREPIRTSRPWPPRRRLAIDAGADFIKTSTGKIAVSATPEAAETMLSVIRDCGPAGRLQGGGRHPHAGRRRALSRPRRGHHGRRAGPRRHVPHRREQPARRADRGHRRRQPAPAAAPLRPSRATDDASAGDHPQEARRRRAQRRRDRLLHRGPDRRHRSPRARPRPSPWRCSSAA